MVMNYRYSWRAGALVKVDPEGNILDSSQAETVSLKKPAQSFPPDTSSSQSRQDLDAMEEEPLQTPMVADEGFHTMVDSNSSEPQSPEKPILSKDDLARRDREAVAYSKDLLVEGDTLVYITYPGGSKCFDTTGFELSDAPHRVHSSRLLATGSKMFAKMLSPTSQYRIVRKKKLVGNLPIGIKYVLDLTPPDEGEEAVQLTSELSCSLGVRLWYTAAQRCGISHNLVGGEDEVTDPKTVTSSGTPTAGAPLRISEINSGPSKSVSNQAVNSSPEYTTWDSLQTARQNREIENALRMSLEELAKSQAKKAKNHDIVEVPEYCPIRHRAGIARLLRMLEGKDPRLDSAPKVWTLFVLAKYFDCTSAVVDWIVSWIIADPNTQFIEILPEVSCKMAFGLNNQMICRAAFSILVSEEALSLASREMGLMDADRRGTNQFGRLREDIDEDLRTRIEYASKNFASRVCKVFEVLVENEMTWVTQLPEYQKLQHFRSVVLCCVDIKQTSDWLSAIDKLTVELKTYIRSQILACLAASLPLDIANKASANRRAESYTNVNMFASSNSTFSLFYDQLLDKERIFTRFFWLFLLHINLPAWLSDSRPSDSDPGVRGVYSLGPRPSVSTLLSLQQDLNESILETIQKGLFKNGILPEETIPRETQTHPSTINDNQNYHHACDTVSCVSGLDVQGFQESWDINSTFKFGSTPKEAPVVKFDVSSTSDAHDNWKNDGVESKCDNDWNPWTFDDTKPLIPSESKEMGIKNQNFSHDNAITGLEKMDFDEYLALHHLIYPQPDLQKVAPSKGLPLRPKNQTTSSPAQDSSTGLGSMKQTVRHSFESSKIQAIMDSVWMQENCFKTVEANENNQPRQDAGSYLNRILNKAPHDTFNPKSYMGFHSIQKPIVKPIIPGDNLIPRHSPLFNISNFFGEAEDHIRHTATAMLDQRDMGFDIVLTDTLLCLGPEEFKYLPLWAGGNDDGSGGVFDDTIPFPLAGPNGPGPSFHTGFSSASAASSSFDAMSDRTAFNTSVAVEDGFGSHIDRRLVVADDDFHSETFSENSEIYDRKGKGVDRGGLYANAPASEADFSIADTTLHSMADIESSGTSDDGSFEMEFEEEDSDADTTTGQIDGEPEDETWDGGDSESFDFGDSDEEMANV